MSKSQVPLSLFKLLLLGSCAYATFLIGSADDKVAA